MARGVPGGVPLVKKMTKTKFCYNTSQNIEPKFDEMVKNAKNETLIWVIFFLFLGLLKATKQLSGYVRWPGVSHWYQKTTKTIFW